MSTIATQAPSLAVWYDPSDAAAAQQLAKQLGLPLVSGDLRFIKPPYVLRFSEQGLEIQQTGKKAAGPVRIDFAAGATAHRRHFGGGELILKAIGGSASAPPSVVDLTAGLGRDSFVMACRGCEVTMIERSPIIAAMLRDALARAEQEVELADIIHRMHLVEGQALAYLQQANEYKPDVVYIDPMFPASKKAALVKKDMQAFHQVVGADSDSDQLLAAALAACKHRVVVKRPKKAPPLADTLPNFTIEGKAIRFDIYSLKAFNKH